MEKKERDAEFQPPLKNKARIDYLIFRSDFELIPEFSFQKYEKMFSMMLQESIANNRNDHTAGYVELLTATRIRACKGACCVLSFD